MKSIKVTLAGAGAFGVKHLDALRNIEGVEVISLVEPESDKVRDVAARYGIGHCTADLDESLPLKELDVVILCNESPPSPSQERGGGEGAPPMMVK